MDYGKFYVIALKLKDGTYDLVDCSDEEFSKRDVRRAFKRFKTDGDVSEAMSMDAARFFDSKRSMDSFFSGMYNTP